MIIDIQSELAEVVRDLGASIPMTALWVDGDNLEITGIKSDAPANFEMLPEGYLPGEVFTYTVLRNQFPDAEPENRHTLTIGGKNYQIRSILTERDFLTFNLSKVK